MIVREYFLNCLKPGIIYEYFKLLVEHMRNIKEIPGANFEIVRVFETVKFMYGVEITN